MNAKRPILPGRSAQCLFEMMFPINEKTRSEVTEDGGQERYERTHYLLRQHMDTTDYEQTYV